MRHERVRIWRSKRRGVDVPLGFMEEVSSPHEPGGTGEMRTDMTSRAVGESGTLQAG